MRVKAIHAQIANRRKDVSDKCSTKLVCENRTLFVGKVNASGLAKMGTAKSVLTYKSTTTGVLFREVNEAYSTQTCSCCDTMSGSGPKNIPGLGIREWICSECGAHHDRNVNVAKSILARGRARLAEGIPVFSSGSLWLGTAVVDLAEHGVKIFV